MVKVNERLRNNVISALEKLGIDMSNKRYTKDNVMIGCPFASAKNSGHKSILDKHPSFGIKISDKGFLYHCFTCGRHGESLIDLVDTLIQEGVVKDGLTAYEVQNALKIVFPDYSENYNPESKEKKKAVTMKNFQDLPKEFWDYNIKKRGLKESIIKELKLKYDMKHEQVLFPNYTKGGSLEGFVAHYINGRQPKYSNNFDTGNSLYLEWLIKSPTAIVVEGMYDTAIIYQYLNDLNLLGRFSVVGMYGAQVSFGQLDLLAKHFDSLILMGDNDEAGFKMQEFIYYRLRKKIPLIYKINYVGKDPAKITSAKLFEMYLRKELLPYKALAMPSKKYI